MAVHRKHHAFTTKVIPTARREALAGPARNVYYYVREIKKTDVVQRYARDTGDDWWDTHLSNKGLLVGRRHHAAVPHSRSGDRFGVDAAGAGIHAVMYVFVLSSSINGLGATGRLQELREYGDEHPRAGADHGRRRAPQQPSRLSAQPEVQLPRERSIPRGR